MDIKYYTLAEVATNAGKDNSRVWIIIKDNIYDVTDYLDEHPGSGDVILEWAGKDASKAFNNVGHSGDAKKHLKKLKIGELAESDRTKKHEKNLPEKLYTPNNPERKRGSWLAVITCGICT